MKAPRSVALILAAMLVSWFALTATTADAAAGKGGEDWPTVQHDFQRTGYTAVCPEPPWRVRWVWSNGEKVDRTGVRPDQFGVDKLPDFLTVRFVSLVQPMVWKGAAYVGSVEGRLFAIDLKTGETKWKAKAAGPILHSVSIADDKVFVPTMRGVDAFDLTGKRIWHFDDRRFNGFWANPAYADGAVLIGSLSGYFYAIDGKSGKERWHFRAGGPVCHCPAVWKNSVFFGAEDMHAYCLDVRTGKPNWRSERLPGLTFKHHWPVVAAKQGMVIFRTASLTNSAAAMRAAEKALNDYEKAQQAMRKVLTDRPYEQTLFLLDLATGKERLMVASGYLSLDEIPVPPIVGPDGSVLGWHWSQGGAFQPKGRFAGYASPVDFGEIDFETGLFKRLGPVGSLRYPTIVRNDDFHYNTMGGKYLFGIQHGLAWGATRLDRDKHHTCGGGIHYAYQRMGKQGVTWPGVRFALGFVAPTITEDLVLLNPLKGTFFAALEADPTETK
jgi:outer membrane protein assembly factor BamB